jgi:anti-sigma regulatory factor (Ser/Thr protein kinase)
MDPESSTLDLRGSTMRSLADLRRWVAHRLGVVGDTHRADVVLVAGELVTNAYQHGDGPHEVRMNRSHSPCEVVFEVDDASSVFPTLRASRCARW